MSLIHCSVNTCLENKTFIQRLTAEAPIALKGDLVLVYASKQEV